MWKRKMDETNETEDEEYLAILDDAIDFQKRLLKQLFKSDIKKMPASYLSTYTVTIVENIAKVMDARREFTRCMEGKRENEYE